MMEIPVSAFLFLLSERMEVSAREYENMDLTVKGLRFLDIASYSDGYVYVIDSPDKLRPIEDPSGSCFLMCGHAPDEASGVIISVHGVGEFDLINETLEIFRRLHEWECRLKDAVHIGQSLNKMLEIGKEVLDIPCAIIDRNFRILAFTEDAIGGFGNRTVPFKEWSQLPSEVADEFLVDLEFIKSNETIGPYIFQASDLQLGICYNFLHEGQYLARITSRLRKNDFIEGQMFLFGISSGYAAEVYKEHTDDVLVKRQNDDKHIILKELLYGTYLLESAVHAIMTQMRWKPEDQLIVTVMRFERPAEFNMAALHMCTRLESEWSRSYAISGDMEIVWVANHSLNTTDDMGREFHQSLAYYVRGFVCKAGVSDYFAGLSNLRFAYLQADAALNVGSERDPHFWYYFFDKYKLNYILGRVTSELPADKLCHQATIQLSDYDKLNSTQLSKTLLTYIRHKFNVAAASKELYIHPTTLFRRLERISEIAQIDFDDYRCLLHIQISYEISRDAIVETA